MFHWQDGWFFSRLSDGSVEILKRAESKDDAPVVARATITEAEWASIVASVSERGETYDRWMAARRFHGTVVGDQEYKGETK